MSSVIYQKNLEALKAHRPHLYQLVKSAEDSASLELIAKDNFYQNVALKMADGSQKLYYPNDAIPYSQDLIAKTVFKNPRIVLFLGMGLGYHVIEYCRRPHPLNRVVMIVEAFPQMFQKALMVADFTPLILSDKIQFFVGQDLNQLDQFFSAFFSNTMWLRFAGAIEKVFLEPATNINDTFFTHVRLQLAKAIGHQFNLHYGSPYDSFRGLKNILANLPRLVEMAAIDQAQGTFTGKPGVLIASGPSLKHSLPYLKKIKDHAVLIPCPSALPLLNEEGIEPAIWLDIEREADDAAFFRSLPQKSSKVFVGLPLLVPETFDLPNIIPAFMLSAVYSSWLPFDDVPITKFGHSSAHAAFALLQKLGCDPIILLGQDLSYSDDQSHAGGVWDATSDFHQMFRKEVGRNFVVEGNNGQPVEVNLFWNTFLKSFAEDLIPNCPAKVYNVIPESMGAKIFGAERVDPQALPDLLKTEPFKVYDVLRQNLARPSEVTVEKRKQTFIERASQAIQSLQRAVVDNDEFTIKCKELQFRSELTSRDWQRAKQLYLNFNKELEAFFARFYDNPSYQKDRFPYLELFHPIVQGYMLKGFIKYFESAADLDGDFNVINEKIDQIHQMAKEQSFWARQVIKLLQDSLAEISKR